jgi:hypothetical protein
MRRVRMADVRGMFAQESLRFWRIETIRDVRQVHQADRAGGQKSAFSEDPFTCVVIQGQLLTGIACDQHERCLFVCYPELIFESAQSPADGLHRYLFFIWVTARPVADIAMAIGTLGGLLDSCGFKEAGLQYYQSAFGLLKFSAAIATGRCVQYGDDGYRVEPQKAMAARKAHSGARSAKNAPAKGRAATQRTTAQHAYKGKKPVKTRDASVPRKGSKTAQVDDALAAAVADGQIQVAVAIEIRYSDR